MSRSLKNKKKTNFYIIATRPFKRLLFLNVENLDSDKNFLRKKIFLIRLFFTSNLGSFSIFIFVKNFLNILSENLIFNVGFIMEKSKIKVLQNLLTTYLMGIRYAWMTIFSIEGYHYRAFLTKLKSVKKSVIIFRLGFFYNLMILFSKNIKIYWKKRLFRLRGSNLLELLAISSYIRIVRNLFPYKIKGIIYDNYAKNKPDFEKEQFPVKPGKKSKVR